MNEFLIKLLITQIKQHETTSLCVYQLKHKTVEAETISDHDQSNLAMSLLSPHEKVLFFGKL
jgi:hypothetical protein